MKIEITVDCGKCNGTGRRFGSNQPSALIIVLFLLHPIIGLFFYFIDKPRNAICSQCHGEGLIYF